MPPFHWWRTVFFLIPRIARVHDRARHAVARLEPVRPQRGYFAHWCARMWSRLILATTGVRVVVAGLERLEPGRTYVFVAEPPEHLRHSDPVLVAAVSAADHREGIARKLSVPGLASSPHRSHARRPQAARSRTRIFGWASRLTSNGLSLIVFPEGTRSRDGRVARFKGGSFYLALEAGLPVVPLSVVGSRHVMLKGRLATYPGEVRLVVHEPIDTHGTGRLRSPRSSASASGGSSRPTPSPISEPRRPTSMRFTLAPDLVSHRPSRRAVARWRDRRRARRRAWTRPLAAAEAAVRAHPPAEIAAVRTMYKRVGLDPTKTRPSSEALLRRVRKGDSAAAHQLDGRRLQLVLARVPAAVRAVRRRAHRRRRRAAHRPAGRVLSRHPQGRCARRRPHRAGRSRRTVRQPDVRLGAHDGDDRDDARACSSCSRRERWSRGR